MSLRLRFLLTAILIVLIFLADIVANRLYLYWTYVGLDKIMHLFGGLAAGLVVLAGCELFEHIKGRLPIAIIGALVVGIVWEFVEFGLHISHFGPNFLSDTLTDLLADFIGGIISYYIWIRLPQQA